MVNSGFHIIGVGGGAINNGNQHRDDGGSDRNFVISNADTSIRHAPHELVFMRRVTLRHDALGYNFYFRQCFILDVEKTASLGL